MFSLNSHGNQWLYVCCHATESYYALTVNPFCRLNMFHRDVTHPQNNTIKNLSACNTVSTSEQARTFLPLKLIRHASTIETGFIIYQHISAYLSRILSVQSACNSHLSPAFIMLLRIIPHMNASLGN